ncbi:MAG: endonuclease [Candidatus Delongbacteria bacterium]|nr:endonuclease [Candidatus Delongbacteria bacterium]
MNRPSTHFALLALTLLPLSGQCLVIHPSQIDFGLSETDDSTAASAWLVNDQEEPLLPSLLGDSGDAIRIGGELSEIAPGDSLQLELWFQPEQNLDYAGSLVLGGSEGAALLEYTGAGDFPGTTWDDTAGLSGQALLDVLRARVRQHSVLSYTTARTHMFSTIDNVNGQVECVYTGTLVTTSGIPPATTMNTEHSWPQSRFEDPDTATTDLHHLYPTMATVNSSRSNLPFGNVVYPDAGWPQGGSWLGEDENFIQVFEPRDEHKGDVARSLLYFAIHYTNWYDFLTYMEPTLRQWAVQDPVSNKERARNTAIEAVQGNRNPLVDQPALIDRIYSFSGSADFPNNSNLQFWPAALDLGVETDVNETFASLVLHNGGSTSVSLWALAATPALLDFDGFPASLAPGESRLWSLRLSADAEPGEYDITVNFRSTAGNRSFPVRVTLAGSAVPDAEPLPALFTLHPATPNPFNPSTRLSFSLREAASLSLELVDISGRRVRQWSLPGLGAGEHELSWDGLADSGMPAASGVYLLSLRESRGRAQQVQRLLLLR